MAIITGADVFPYLAQLNPADPDDLALMNLVAARASDIVETELANSGLRFGTWPTNPSEWVALGEGSPQLALPAHKPGGVSAVTDEGTGDVITDWIEEVEDGNLHLLSEGYSLGYWEHGIYGRWASYPSGRVWTAGRRFLVNAIWGAGPAPPALQEVAVELAVNLWREKDKGVFTDVIGV